MCVYLCTCVYICMGTWVGVLDVCWMCIVSESHTLASRVYGEVPRKFTFRSSATHQCTLAYARVNEYIASGIALNQ